MSNEKVSLEDAHGKLLSEWATVANEIEDTLDLLRSGLYTEDSLYDKLQNLLTRMKN